MDKLQLELLAIALYQEQARVLIDADVLSKAWLFIDIEERNTWRNLAIDLIKEELR